LLTVSPSFPLTVIYLGFLIVGSGYYDGATELYEYGWSQSFHFSRFYKGEAFLASLARHEHYLASQMVLRPGMRVLDVGCGVGGPAREIAHFTDARIVGLNNNDFQIGRARKYAKKAGLENQVTFVKGDFMKLSEKFGENSFDAGRVIFIIHLFVPLTYKF
jgi:sterol 24-C-methyltransferase